MAPHLATAASKAKDKAAGVYVAGDIHNHSTCSDGVLSMKKLIDRESARQSSALGQPLNCAGRWQLKEMEIRNVRADSKTTIAFDLPDE